MAKCYSELSEIPITERIRDTLYGLTYIRAANLKDNFYEGFKAKLGQRMDLGILEQGLNNYYKARLNLLTLILVHIPSYSIFFFYFAYQDKSSDMFLRVILYTLMTT